MPSAVHTRPTERKRLGTFSNAKLCNKKEPGKKFVQKVKIVVLFVK